MSLIERLVRSPEGMEEGGIDRMMKEMRYSFDRHHYDAIIDERESMKKCGFFPCPNTLGNVGMLSFCSVNCRLSSELFASQLRGSNRRGKKQGGTPLVELISTADPSRMNVEGHIEMTYDDPVDDEPPEKCNLIKEADEVEEVDEFMEHLMKLPDSIAKPPCSTFWKAFEFISRLSSCKTRQFFQRSLTSPNPSLNTPEEQDRHRRISHSFAVNFAPVCSLLQLNPILEKDIRDFLSTLNYGRSDSDDLLSYDLHDPVWKVLILATLSARNCFKISPTSAGVNVGSGIQRGEKVVTIPFNELGVDESQFSLLTSELVS